MNGSGAAIRPTTRAPMGHAIRDIEILRAVAVFMVFVEHLPVNLLWWRSDLFHFADQVWHGAMGVDLFFAISGFVIARSLLPQIEQAGSADRLGRVLGAFFLRRALRLLPSAWLWLAVPLALSWWYAPTSEFGDYAGNRLMAEFAFFNVADVYVAATIDVALTHARYYGPSIVTWSLSLEEQFYLVLPVAAIVCRAWLPRLLLAALAYQFLVPFTPLTDFTRPGALAVGVLLAIASRHAWYQRLRPSPLGRWLPLRVALLAGCVALLGVLGVNSTSWKLGVVAILSGLLVFVASFDGFYLWPDRWTGAAMAWIGNRSYSLYLTHMTALCGTRKIVQHVFGVFPPHARRLEAGAVCTAFVIALVMAEFCFRLVERPCTSYGRRLSERVLSGGWSIAQSG